MKILMILPLTLAALFSKASVISSNYLDYFMFSPLYLDGDSTFVLKASKKGLAFLVSITNDLYTKKVICTDKLLTAGTYTYTYNNAYTRDNNTISVQLKAGSKILATKSFEMNVSSGKSKVIKDNKPIKSDNVMIRINSDLTVEDLKITYNFTNFDGLYIPEYYHKIKLSDFLINISEEYKPFFDCTPSLIIRNVNGVFNDVSKSNNVEFQLKLVQSNLGYTFELKNDLYVNKETLLLSKTVKTGYVKTKHIYLPRNDMRNQNKYVSYFAISNFGIDKDFLRHNFEFRALQNIIGDCSNSEYCIERT